MVYMDQNCSYRTTTLLVAYLLTRLSNYSYPSVCISVFTVVLLFPIITHYDTIQTWQYIQRVKCVRLEGNFACVTTSVLWSVGSCRRPTPAPPARLAVSVPLVSTSLGMSVCLRRDVLTLTLVGDGVGLVMVGGAIT